VEQVANSGPDITTQILDGVLDILAVTSRLELFPCLAGPELGRGAAQAREAAPHWPQPACSSVRLRCSGITSRRPCLENPACTVATRNKAELTRA
jgi:hypothetical protein